MVNIRAFFAFLPLPVKAPAAVCTEYLSFENIRGIGLFGNRPAFLTYLFPLFLHRCKKFPANDWFMGAFRNNQVVLAGFNLLVVYNLCLALH